MVGTLQYETDRARFLGRGRTIRDPIAIEERRPLSNTAGTVLDPVFSLRRRLRLAPGATVRVHLATVVAESRESALALAGKYRDPATFDRVSSLAWTQAQVQLRHLGISTDEAHLFQRLATRILYSDPTLRAPVETLLRNRRGPSAFWGHGISGDIPIVLVRIDQVEDQGIVRQLLRAHEYWRMKGLAVDLVIVNEQPASYSPELGAALESLVRAGARAPGVASEDSTGRVFVLRGELLSGEERDALGGGGARRPALAARARSRSRSSGCCAGFPPRGPRSRSLRGRRPPTCRRRGSLSSSSTDMGGFSEEEGEYVTLLGERQWTPAPWINVLANSSFGCLVSESGSGYTWAVNSRENQLTPWSNDPVSDPPGEALFLRDEETGEIWSPTPLPIRGDGSYVVRHGQGYSRFEYEHRGIATDLTVFVPQEDPVKISRLSIENRSASHADAHRHRLRGVGARSAESDGGAVRRHGARLRDGRDLRAQLLERSLTPGASRSPTSGAQDDALDGRSHRVSRAQRRSRRPGGAGARSRRSRGAPARASIPAPCCRCGCAWPRGSASRSSSCSARAATPWRRGSSSPGIGSQDPDVALAAVRREWEDTLTALQVRTPDRSMDLMLNRWLLYQTLGCRLQGARGLLPGGRRLGLPRPAAGRRCPSRSRGGSWRAISCCAPPPGSSRRATSSTGGTIPKARGCEPGSPTICCGCPTRPTTTSRSPAIAACSTSRSRSSRRRPSSRGRPIGTSSRTCPPRRRPSSSTARGRSIGASRSAATGCR